MRMEKIYLLGDDFLNYLEIIKKWIVCEQVKKKRLGFNFMKLLINFGYFVVK